MDEVQRPVAEDALIKLTPGQLACLRLVMDGRTSKEIAKTLAISPHTVDQRLRLAIQILNVTSRFEAARVVREIDERSEGKPYQESQRPAYQLDHIATEAEERLANTQDDSVPVKTRDVSEVNDQRYTLFEEAAADYVGSSTSTEVRSRSRNIFRPILRLAITIGLMVCVALTLTLLVAVAEGLARLFRIPFN